MSNLSLASIAIHRRTVAIALFQQTHLEEVLVRQLSTDLIKAENAMTGFFRRLIERHQVQLAAFEVPSTESERVRTFRDASEKICRSKGIPIIKVSEQELFQSFAVPALRRKDPLRKIARSLWPILSSPSFGRASLDAAVLGLHVQVERFFAINSLHT